MKLVLELCERYLRDIWNIRFLRYGATGANHLFFPLGGKSLFLGADWGEKAMGNG